ncbi:lysozyme inhibitor LprI family protein [Pelagibacterium xiamenense]|uniref:lysozyme inhibitor LprI family protein n=1 Tax=Pelagibacterium xiamenense TaxID=2901140 RepID=UPI001E49D482|nr:lysozyme inhibitor LprI family protein [Pelagibacterium xiamenense]MCD7060738.1 lysozyme inhibitor LprI family protein [Pelagibacterium xiamenense]
MRRFVTLAILAACTMPAAAQETGFTPEDDKMLTECVENAGASGGESLAATCIGTVSELCQETPEGSTTIGIVECAARETSWWDKRLNDTYAAVLETLDADRTQSLRDAQRAWIAFRDAECAFAYDYWRDGTIRSVFGASCMLDLTARRAIDLSDILEWSAG